jgi:hypothetical protein
MPQQLLAMQAQHGSGNEDQSATTTIKIINNTIHNNHENNKTNLKTIISHYLEILSNFTNQPLEGELPDQELSTLLVLPNLTVMITIQILDTDNSIKIQNTKHIHTK